MKTNPNDPANALMPSHTDPASIKGTWFQGLTKHEHFAAMAMQGMLALSVNVQAEVAAESAVMYADALIEALNKEEQ